MAQKVEKLNLARCNSSPFAPSLEHEELNSILEIWERSLDLRPVWAGFWEDVVDMFGQSPSTDSNDWPEDLRDRLGLYHIDPAGLYRSEIPIVVFRYPVSDLPRL